MINGIGKRNCEKLMWMKTIQYIAVCGIFLFNNIFADALCEPIYNVERQILTYGVGQQLTPNDSCNPAVENCQNTFIIVGQPLVNTASQHLDDNGDYETVNITGDNSFTSSSISNKNSFGYFNDYIAEPKPPLIKASDGDFQDKVLVQWEIQGCHEDDSNCASVGPQITGDDVTLYRNGYVLTTLPIEQIEYQDFNVFPGEYYTYGVTVSNDIGPSQKAEDVGFLNPNGVITGNIETPSGTPMANTKVILTPNLGRSAKFDGDGYVYWFDEEINGNRQFDQLKNDYTIEFWFRSVHDQNQTLFSAFDTNLVSNQIEIFLDDNGKVNWNHKSKNIISHESYTDDGDWHHLAVVKSSSDMTMYIDGFIIGEESGATNITNSHQNNLEFVIGKKSPLEHDNYYIGRLDDFRIWNIAREWDDILNLMDITLSGSETNLYAYYKFDEIDGETVFDLTDGNRDGKTCRVERDDQFAPVFQGALTDEQGNYAIQGIYYASGTTFTVTPSKSTPIGRSIELDGVDDFVSFGAQRIDLSSEFTVEGWFKSSESIEQVIFSAVEPVNITQYDLSIRLNSSGNLEMHYVDDVISTSDFYNEGLWHHYAVTFDGINLVGYIDGNEFESTPVTTLIDGDSKFIFGADYDQSSNLFSGRLDEFRSWDLVRNAEQVNGTMNQTLSGDEYGFVHYWQMNDGTGTILTNSKSTIAGTMNGEIAWSKDIPLNEYFEHWYEPESRQATLNHTNTSIDAVSFSDQSLIPVSGYANFAETSCFQELVQIKLNGESTIPQTFTDENGKFTVELEPGSIGNTISAYYTDNYISYSDDLICLGGTGDGDCIGLKENDVCSDDTGLCQYNSNDIDEIVQLSPPNIELPLINQPITGLNFINNTKRELDINVSGGECNMPLTPSQGEIIVELRSVDGCYENSFELEINQTDISLINIPPLNYNLSISHPDPEVNSTFMGQSVELINNDNLKSKFHYDPPIEIELGHTYIKTSDTERFNNILFCSDYYYTDTDCSKLELGASCGNGTCVSYNGCSDFPYIFKYQQDYDLDFKVIERYGNNTCPLKNFDVTVYDNISNAEYSDVADKSKHENVGDIDFINIPILPENINTLDGGEHPYQLNLQIDVSSNGRNASEVIWAVVLGPNNLEVENFVVNPLPQPEFILRVPPGDESYAYIEQDQSWCSHSNGQFVNSQGLNAKTALRTGIKKELEFGVGFAATSTEIQVTSEFGFGLSVSRTGKAGVSIEKCLSSAERFTTSPDGLLTGKDRTLFIGQGESYTVGMSEMLKLDNQQCEISKESTFSLTALPNTESYIHSRFYINNVMIPLIDDIGDLSTIEDVEYELDLLDEDYISVIDEEYIYYNYYNLRPYLALSQFSGGEPEEANIQLGGNYLLKSLEIEYFGNSSINIGNSSVNNRDHTTFIPGFNLSFRLNGIIVHNETIPQIPNSPGRKLKNIDFNPLQETDEINISIINDDVDWQQIRIYKLIFKYVLNNDIKEHWINILNDEDNRVANPVVGNLIVSDFDEDICVLYNENSSDDNCIEVNDFDFSNYCNNSVICNEDEGITISYDSGAEYEYTTQTTGTSSRNSEFSVNIDTQIGYHWVSQIGGWAYNSEIDTEFKFEHNWGYGNTGTTSRKVGFVLSDDDPGDGYIMNIHSDENFGGMIFTLEGGQSSCPWEVGTLKRHKSQLLISENAIYDVPPDEPAIFTLYLGNASETGDDNFYNLSYLAETNPHSAQIWTGANLAPDGVDYYLTADQSQEVTLQVFRGPEEYEYEDITIQLAPPCEKEIAFDLGSSQPTNSERVNITVHFQEPCTESHIAVPEDGWLIDGTYNDQYLWVTVNGYDQFDGNLESIDLQYRQVGGGDWFSAFNVPKPNGVWDDGESFTDLDDDNQYDIGEEFTDVGCTKYACEDDGNGNEICEIVCLIDDYILMPFNIDPSIIIDGEYELRTQALCGGGKYPGTSQIVTGIIDRSAPEVLGLPEPINGILGADDLIKVTLNEDVQCGEISIGAGDIALFNSVTGNPVDFDFTCGGNIITIEPIPANIWIENQTLRAEIHNLEDTYGNTRALDEPIVWEFFVNRNPIEWTGTNVDNIVIRIDEEYSTSRQLVNNGGSNRSYQMIGGREAGLMSGDPLELPPWLNISPLEGTLTPGSAQDITIELQEGLNFGHYQSTIYASGTMGDEPMLVDIRKLCHDPDWQINSADFQYSMNLTATLTTDGEQSIDEYDFVGVFVGDELRGVAQVSHVPAIEDILDVAPYEVFLTIYSNQATGENLEFRVWDASECTELGDIEEQYSFVANSVIGSLISPTNITATSQITSNITFPQGYSWFSINLTNEDMDLNKIIKNLNFTTDDIIKDQTSFAQYVDGEGWIGPLEEIDPQSMYLISFGNANNLELKGYAVDVELDTIDVSTGWNWIGYTPQYSINVNEALESLNSATGDIIKSQDGYAQFIENYGWFGSLSYMEPKEGYMLRSSYAGELLYPYEIRSNVNPEEFVQPQLIAENAPAWDVNINQFEHSMTITAIGQVNGIQLNDELDMLGAFVTVETENGPIEECRGVSQPIFVDALDQYMGFLMVYSNNPGEEIHFKLFDADQDLVWSVYESSEFSPNAMVGELFEPYPLNAEPPIGDVTFDGFLNVQDILKVVNFILDVETLTSMERIVADLNFDEAINVADIVEMIALILDSPLVKAEEEVTVELRIQGKTVSIYSDNNVRGLQFTLPGHSEINSNYDVFTNVINGGLNSVITNIESNIIQDGELFKLIEDDIEFNNLIIVGKNGGMLDFDIRYIPMSFGLSQNYPNPFNPETTIKFELPKDSEISIQVFDVNGRLVNEILSSTLQAGYHQINWRAEDKSGIPLANGIYFYRMITPQFSDVKKMLLIK